MVTESKKEEIARLNGYFMESSAVVFADFRGVKAEDMTALRSKLRESNSRLKVVKNTLARIAIKQTPFEEAKEFFEGPVSVAFTSGEEVNAPAKALLDFAREHDNLTIIGGMVEGSVLDKAGVRALAAMPPKPVIQATLLGLMQAPARNMLGLLEGVARTFLYALNAIAEKKKEKDQG